MSEAETVAAALRALQTRPQWVLLDLMLPDGCGTEVLRRARSADGACKVCVITGAGPERVDAARALGPQFVFKKPLEVDELLAAMRA